jgi:hypothetical protein
MNADNSLACNPRLSVFIRGQSSFCIQLAGRPGQGAGQGRYTEQGI